MVYFRFFSFYRSFFLLFFPVKMYYYRMEKGRNSRCNILSVFLTTFSWFIFDFLSSFSRFYSRLFPFLSRLKKPGFLNNKKKTNSRWSLSAFVYTYLKENYTATSRQFLTILDPWEIHYVQCYYRFVIIFLFIYLFILFI